MKRINVDKVRELFDSKGLTPVQFDNDSNFVFDRKSNCLMSAVLYPQDLNPENIERACFHKDYSYGVMEGWDNRFWWSFDIGEERVNRQSLEYKLGHADGSYTRRIIFGV